jgi:hypothetical protein
MPKTTKRRDVDKYRLLPPLDPETYAGLKANIAVNGVQVPVIRDEKGYILDGFARAKIARELGYECPFVVVKGLTEQEKRSGVRALNLARRHLDHPARTLIIADELRENPERSNRWIAKSLGVDDKAVARVRAGMQATAALPQLGFTLGSDGKYRPKSRGDVPTNGNGKQAPVLPGAELRDCLDLNDEEAILRAATEIRQRRIAERGRLEAEREEVARLKLKGKRTWTLTDDPKVVRCDLLIVDPPFGITDEPWEPEDVEGFNRGWCEEWSRCGADFIAIFWCQERLWEGRTWFDQSLKGYQFQQVLTWQANNHCGPKSRLAMKQSWYPIFLYRKRHSSRRIVRDDKAWDTERHNLDCHVAPLPQTTYRGEELKQHPCQKPVSVMRWLINALSEPGELVCSLFAGVAPCGVAAVQLGRRYRGIEQSAEYRRISEGRIAAYKDLPRSYLRVNQDGGVGSTNGTADQDVESNGSNHQPFFRLATNQTQPRASNQETPPVSPDSCST